MGSYTPEMKKKIRAAFQKDPRINVVAKKLHISEGGVRSVVKPLREAVDAIGSSTGEPTVSLQTIGAKPTSSSLGEKSIRARFREMRDGGQNIL